MGFYSATPDMPLGRKGVYLSENQPIGTQHRFKVLIEICKETAPGGHGDQGNILEFAILESDFAGNPVGSRAGQFISQTKFPKLGLAEVMKFTTALYGGDPRIDEQVRQLGKNKLMQWTFDTTQNKPMLDQKPVMVVRTHVSATKKPGGVFTHYNWETCENPPNIDTIAASLGLMND